MGNFEWVKGIHILLKIYLSKKNIIQGIQHTKELSIFCKFYTSLFTILWECKDTIEG